MSEEPIEDTGPVLPGEPDGELVHWMSRPPLHVGPAALTAAAATAFALGAVAVVAVFALAGWLPPRETVARRPVSPPGTRPAPSSRARRR